MARRVPVREQRRATPTRGRRRVPRWQIERQRQRMALAIGAVVLVFILALPLWGYITTFVLPPRQVVATINGETISMRDLLKSVRVLQRGVEATGIALDLGTQPFQTLNALVENELIRQMAPQLGIAVGTQEVDSEIRARLLGDIEAEDPAALETEFQERLRQYLNLVQLSEKEYRDRVMLDLLREQAREVVGRDVPPIQPQIHLFQITLENEERLEQVQTLSEEGTPFEELLQEYEVNEASKENGGEVAWLPRGLLGEQGDTLFDLEVGELSEPGLNEDGTFVLFIVKEKAEAREVQEEHLTQLKQSALEDWINETRQEQDVDTTFGSEQYDWLVKQLRNFARV